MPDQQVIDKAYLQKISWSNDNRPQPEGDPFYVQFNPQTLKVTYNNQKSGGDQGEEAAIQFVGRGTTKLSVDLIFDVTIPMPDGSEKEDVSDLTARVVEFIKPVSQGQRRVQGKMTEVFLPPGIRFGWGTFLFEGVVDSVDETLDFFSNQGKPLRATVRLSLSRQDIVVRVQPNGTPGTRAQEPVREGESLQALADRLGLSDWRPVAAANNVENPRQPGAGTLVDPAAPASAGGLGGSFGAGFSAGISGGISGGFSAGISGGFSAGVSGGFSAGVSGGFSAGVSGGFSAGVSGGFSAGVSGGFSAGGGVSAGAASKLSIQTASSLGFGASSRISGGFAAGGLGGGTGLGGLGAGATATAGATASLGPGGASASAGASLKTTKPR